MPTPYEHLFAREEHYPSWMANALQLMMAGAASDFRLRRQDDTTIAAPVREPLGIVTLPIQGRWRWRETTVTRAIPGGNGTFDVWAVAEDNEVTDSPDPHTDHTNRSFDLRITATGVPPSGAGVEVYEKVGELVVAGGVITSLKQVAGAVSGGMIEDGALEAGAGMTILRLPSGALQLTPAAQTVEGKPTVRLFRTTTLTNPEASASEARAVSFDAESWDTDGMHSGVTNPTRITCPAGKGGIYTVWASATVNQNGSSGPRTPGMAIFKNGTEHVCGVGLSDIVSGSFNDPEWHAGQSGLGKVLLEPGDYVELFLRMNSATDAWLPGAISFGAERTAIP